jgi:hypothetical protein
MPKFEDIFPPFVLLLAPLSEEPYEKLPFELSCP